MRKIASIASVLLLAGGLACGGASNDSGSLNEGADAAADGATDATPEPIFLPTWSLEDIQPESTRFGQTYGLDVFDGQVIVAVLVEGF
jgi:hypothetical protein